MEKGKTVNHWCTQNTPTCTQLHFYEYSSLHGLFEETDSVSSVLLAAAVQHLIRLHVIGIFPVVFWVFFPGGFSLFFSELVLQTSYIFIPWDDAVIWLICFQDTGEAWLCPH